MNTDHLPPICADCEDHGDGSYTCDSERPACRYNHLPEATPDRHGAKLADHDGFNFSGRDR